MNRRITRAADTLVDCDPPSKMLKPGGNRYHHRDAIGPMALFRARRFAAVMGSPKYTTVHEMNSLDVWKSKAWDEWRTAVTPVWSGEIRQAMVHAEGSPGVFRRIFPA